MPLRRDVYSGRLKLHGEEGYETLTAANNYAKVLVTQARFAEAKALLRNAVPVARRVIGESHEVTLKIRWIYAMALYMDTGATPDDLREAVTTLEDLVLIARRVFGGAHPLTVSIAGCLRNRESVRGRIKPLPSPR